MPENYPQRPALSLSDAAALSDRYVPAVSAVRPGRRGRGRERLLDGLDRHEFIVHYQPIVDATSQQVVSMEALLRWQHPQRGLLRPSHFIPTAERSGIVHLLDRVALQQVTRQISEWRSAGLAVRPVSINISADHFDRDDLTRFIERQLEQNDCPAEMIELELTESALLRDPAAAARTMNTLQAMGIRLSLDDFGVVYASLNYLRKLPLNKLKIDRSFLHELDDHRTQAVLRGIIDLAHKLDLQVIAEGVETRPQARFLELSRCDSLQGFLFGDVLGSDAAGRCLD
jgi:EAL domain-containing protein (putative c-di-GMP-specific phosphodiesterase class I)